MNLRRWWLPQERLETADNRQSEAYTVTLMANTYPVAKTDIPVFVFTESELREFAETWYMHGFDIGDPRRATFNSYWSQLDINDEKGE